MSTAAVEAGNNSGTGSSFKRELSAVFWLSVGNLIGTWTQIVIALETLRLAYH